MAKTPKRPRDPNQLAKLITDIAIGDSDDSFEKDEKKAAQLRQGSDMAKAREIILKFGKPLYIDDLLRALGKDVTKKNKLSVAGSMSSYVRKNQFFTRPEPNTFGVIEFEQESPKEEITGEDFIMMQK